MTVSLKIMKIGSIPIGSRSVPARFPLVSRSRGGFPSRFPLGSRSFPARFVDCRGFIEKKSFS